MMAMTALVLAGTVLLFMKIPKGFLPSEDNNQIFAFTEAIEGISFDSMVKHQMEANRIVQQDPYVERFFSSAGARGSITASNSGVIFMRLVDRSRARSVGGRGDPGDARPRGRHPGAPAVPAEPAPDPDRRAAHQEPVPVHPAGRRHRTSCTTTRPSWRRSCSGLPGLRDVTTDLQLKNPHVNVDIHRDKASALGISAAAIEGALYDAYGSRQVSTIFAPNNQYKVIVELEERYQNDPSVLSKLYVHSSTGEVVPLEAVADLRPALGPLTVNHSGQLPAVTLSFNLDPGVSLGEAVSEVDAEALRTLPATISTSFQGTAQAFSSSLQGLGLLLVMAILVIYMVLGILYESFVHPITILSALPFAGFGALMTLMMFRHRAVDLRFRRDHHAGRPGEEERHHDDRLRDRGAARTRGRPRPTRSTRHA